MRTLNDVETYEDDYGNTKMLTVEDHSASAKTKIFTSSESEEERIERKAIFKGFLEERRDVIRNLPSDRIEIFLELFDHIIMYDTETEQFLWDLDKLNIILNEEPSLIFIEELLLHNEVTLKLPDKAVKVVTNSRE